MLRAAQTVSRNAARRAPARSLSTHPPFQRKFGGEVVAVVGGQRCGEKMEPLLEVLGSEADVIVRAASDSVSRLNYFENKFDFARRSIPAGIRNPGTTCLLGNGVVVCPDELQLALKELRDDIDVDGRVNVSDRAHVRLDMHPMIEHMLMHGTNKKVDDLTTRGVAACYIAKTARVGIRVCDIIDGNETRLRKLVKRQVEFWRSMRLTEHVGTDPAMQCLLHAGIDRTTQRLLEAGKRIAPLVVDGVDFMNEAIESGKNVMIEGPSSVMLDNDFGAYPHVESSNTSIGGVCAGLGIPPRSIDRVIGVFNAYTAHVGKSPFPTYVRYTPDRSVYTGEIPWRLTIDSAWYERRLGWFDAVQARHAHRISGFDALTVANLGALSDHPKILVATAYRHRGRILSSFPASLDTLADVEVVYETLPGWMEDIDKVKAFEDLPANAKAYVRFIEECVGVPVEWVHIDRWKGDVLKVSE